MAILNESEYRSKHLEGNRMKNGSFQRCKIDSTLSSLEVALLNLSSFSLWNNTTSHSRHKYIYIYIPLWPGRIDLEGMSIYFFYYRFGSESLKVDIPSEIEPLESVSRSQL